MSEALVIGGAASIRSSLVPIELNQPVDVLWRKKQRIHGVDDTEVNEQRIFQQGTT